MKKIKLTKGKYALVDDEDFEWLNQWKWHVITKNNINYYAVRSILNTPNKPRQKVIRMHRLIMNVPFNKEVDHINRNSLDNRKQNLRICTNHENSFNKAKQKTHNKQITSSKYKGVCFRKDNRNWRCRIRFNDKLIDIGSFNTEWAAAMAYNLWAKDLFGEFAYLNYKNQ